MAWFMGYEAIPITILCSKCGGTATINACTHEEEIIDYFYECPCGEILEGK